MIRYEIEKGLFNGDLEVKDLPEIWNDKYEEYLGFVQKMTGRCSSRCSLGRRSIRLFPILCTWLYVRGTI